MAVLICVGCSRAPNPAENESTAQTNRMIADLIECEDLVLDLTPRLSRLADWFETDGLHTDSLVHAELVSLTSVRGLQSANPNELFQSKDGQQPEFVTFADWPIEESESAATNPWAALSSTEADWETMKFGVVSAKFDDVDKTLFTLDTKVEARGQFRDGQAVGLNGHQHISWRKANSQWQMYKWIQDDLTLTLAPQPMFRESLASMLPNERSLRKAQRSYKDEIMIEASKTGRLSMPAPQHQRWTNATSNHIFPSVSVVDYDGDGWDDLFLTARWGPTQLLRNQEGKSFEEVTHDAGLYFEFMVNCAVFADLDNDGDKDAIIGRPMERAVYMQNEGGKYRDVTDELSDLGNQYFTSGISITDINRDGLLDVYLSNYPPLRADESWGNLFLNQQELAEVVKRQANSHRFLNLAGSANVLLMNRGGGRLERVPYDDALSQWRRSFQAVWADIDNDGDDDCYVCNDFAPDAMLRNDTPPGASQPLFKDITSQMVAGAPLGFGMGASWGDYDQDGDLDLYVSNMYSKAGKRIMNQIGEVDARLKAAAAGNFLYENQNGRYRQRAGSDPDCFHVNRVGWSYGGQWADFDNDGRLDLYVPSGYYTAPKEIDSKVDT